MFCLFFENKCTTHLWVSRYFIIKNQNPLFYNHQKTVVFDTLTACIFEFGAECETVGIEGFTTMGYHFGSSGLTVGIDFFYVESYQVNVAVWLLIINFKTKRLLNSIYTPSSTVIVRGSACRIKTLHHLEPNLLRIAVW